MPEVNLKEKVDIIYNGLVRMIDGASDYTTTMFKMTQKSIESLDKRIEALEKLVNINKEE